jgi:hypothetical protein
VPQVAVAAEFGNRNPKIRFFRFAKAEKLKSAFDFIARTLHKPLRLTLVGRSSTQK